ncbi:serine/threonine-protein kinase [Streptacidiphilus carbonis]|uniref:serine/threonine-protein kinase n=1 Tax=Streptacidiphilus carbonis TaxID=105422 RepID=UPI000694B669|nr:serine/threonine-protein kinase [Streptacidiphilus carbonis]
MGFLDDDVPEADPSGELLAQRYQLGEELGRGGSGRVLLAVDQRLRRPVAVKLFRFGGDADTARRFVGEARMLARLRHPGLVEVYDCGQGPSGPFLVLELLPGTSLKALLARAPLPMAEAVRVTAQLAETLAYLHGLGVVHRDIKPSNVLLDRQGRPRLVDFGLARALDEAGATSSGTVVGTAAYLAPEQIHGRGEIGRPADVYALGLLLLEAITGRRAFPGTPVESALARLRRPPVLPAGLPRPLRAVLKRMTASDQSLRPRADEVARLLSALGALPAEGPTPATGRTGRIGRRRVAAWSAAAATALAAGAVLAAVASGPYRDPLSGRPEAAATDPSTAPPASLAGPPGPRTGARPGTTTGTAAPATTVPAGVAGPGSAWSGATAGPPGVVVLTPGQARNAKSHGHGHGQGKKSDG